MKTNMKNYEWETVEEDYYTDAGISESEFAYVEPTGAYLPKMIEQNKKLLAYLQNKYPNRTFRLSKMHPHDFGCYQEVEEMVEYEQDEDEYPND